MSKTSKMIQKLEQSVKKSHEDIQRSVKMTAVFYMLIIILVTTTTLWNYSQIQQLATPENVAALIAQNVESRLPALREKMIKHAETQAPVMADKTIEVIETALPKLEDVAKVQINNAVDHMIDHTFNEIMPQLLDSTQDTFDKISKNHDLINDKRLGEALAVMMADQLDTELDKVIDASFINRLRSLKHEITGMCLKPADKLTKRELAEKKAIIYWLFLVNNANSGNNPFVETLRFVSDVKLNN